MKSRDKNYEVCFVVGADGENTKIRYIKKGGVLYFNRKVLSERLSISKKIAQRYNIQDFIDHDGVIYYSMRELSDNVEREGHTIQGELNSVGTSKATIKKFLLQSRLYKEKYVNRRRVVSRMNDIYVDVFNFFRRGLLSVQFLEKTDGAKNIEDMKKVVRGQVERIKERVLKKYSS